MFGAFNYGPHLFGGYLGGRFLSNRNLFVGGMVLQVIGCACIATGTLALFYVGLALFLTGSGLNMTCINMMLTQRFTPEDPRREAAPRQYQGVMMGSWMLVTGLASLFAGDFSGMIPSPNGTTAVATNPDYAKLFDALGAGSLVVGVALVVLIPFLRKLITDKAEIPPAEMAAATVVPD